jgi:hypothetical protein
LLMHLQILIVIFETNFHNLETQVLWRWPSKDMENHLF